MANTIFTDMIQSRGAAYRDQQIAAWSHYLAPIDDREGRLAGNSRRWGDASPDVQSRVVETLVESARDAGLGARETAHVLAIARIESGFNPDAAAGTTSASGLGQFIDKTGRSYGLDESNRFDVHAQSRALVAHFIDNRDLATRRGLGEAYIYKYHHDGPMLDSGGLALGREHVIPLIDAYTRFVQHTFGIEQSIEGRSSQSDPSSRNNPEASTSGELLREGQRGAGVAGLQAALAGLGFTDRRDVSLEVDGVFGPRTGEVVRAFQHTQGLQVDGVVGPETREALDRAMQVEQGRDVAAARITPVDSLLAAARSGDPDTLRSALETLSATRFGQMFQQAQAAHAAEPDRLAQAQQEQCGPER